MDNSNFGTSHLPSPALVVFSQAANGLSDALRLQRPFHSQVRCVFNSFSCDIHKLEW
jgi:hypothetical protein